MSPAAEGWRTALQHLADDDRIDQFIRAAIRDALAGYDALARTRDDAVAGRQRAEEGERRAVEQAGVLRAELDRHRVAGDGVAESTNALLAKLPYFVGNKVAQAEREACVEADNAWRSVRGDAPAAAAADSGAAGSNLEDAPAAGRDLTALDVADAWALKPPGLPMDGDLVADYLNRIARPAAAPTDGQAPAAVSWDDLHRAVETVRRVMPADATSVICGPEVQEVARERLPDGSFRVTTARKSSATDGQAPADEHEQVDAALRAPQPGWVELRGVLRTIEAIGESAPASAVRDYVEMRLRVSDAEPGPDAARWAPPDDAPATDGQAPADELRASDYEAALAWFRDGWPDRANALIEQADRSVSSLCATTLIRHVLAAEDIDSIGSHERDRELTFLRKHAATLQDGVERAWSVIPAGAEGEDDSLAAHIVAALAAAAPADDTAAPDERETRTEWRVVVAGHRVLTTSSEREARDLTLLPSFAGRDDIDVQAWTITAARAAARPVRDSQPEATDG